MTAAKLWSEVYILNVQKGNDHSTAEAKADAAVASFNTRFDDV